ncbi:circularly permuted type 2 ATP-grasp protein [Aeromicrobium halocynthiae]|uniref:Circularly permuted type 2 ATP-grasp protein n=1 Tax=Aeromicrobium halocynthiae TaxID=560557 RepID=A0ABN2W400_9ACTN
MSALRDYAAATNQPPLQGGPRAFDEVVAPDGTLRRPWRALAAGPLDLADVDLRRVAHQIGRHLEDDGVTYRRPGGTSDRWHLDPLPLVVTAQEWATLSGGLAQRAELLDAVADDLYGPRRLLREGVLPPELVLAHRGFRREVSRPRRAGRSLHVVACDLTRTASGQWQVVADRTQAPSGLGYALENRRVTSRAITPTPLDAPVHRLAPFVPVLRDALAGAAPRTASDPRIVLLTPGPESETAYDQAHLATVLGIPLVRGDDLVVRGGAVWMRVRGRLERVDVVLRRVDAAWSDPLELRGDSRLGVPGLVEADRRGSVRVVNGFGTGVLENPGLLPFMDHVCEVLLDEPLRLPCVPVHWLGDPATLARLRTDLLDLEVRAIDGGGVLDADAPDALLAAVEAAPHRYVAGEPIVWSRAPRLDAGTLTACEVSLRAFTVAHGSGYRPLAGGLGSVLQDGRSIASKDVWVLKESASEPDQGLEEPARPSVASGAAPIAVPRVLQDLYWFGRYAERAEHGVRSLLALPAVGDGLDLDRIGPGDPAAEALLGVLGASGAPGERDARWLQSILLDERRPSSVAQSLVALRAVAASVRDQLSIDVWRAFAVTDRAVASAGTDLAVTAEQVLVGLLALRGTTESMVHDDGWHALEVGRALERALQVGALLSRTVTTMRPLSVEERVHEAVLGATESVVTHRRRHRGRVRLVGLLELLLTDPDNPRSLAAALERLGHALARLPMSTSSSRPERLLEDLVAQVRDVDLSALARVSGQRRRGLEDHLEDVEGQLTRLADAFAELHLVSGPSPRSLTLARRVSS